MKVFQDEEVVFLRPLHDRLAERNVQNNGSAIHFGDDDATADRSISGMQITELRCHIDKRRLNDEILKYAPMLQKSDVV